MPKLDYWTAQEIRRCYHHEVYPVKVVRLAERFGVDESSIQDIVKNRVHKQPPPELLTFALCPRCALDNCIWDIGETLTKKQQEPCPISQAKKRGLTVAQATNGRAKEIGLLSEDECK